MGGVAAPPPPSLSRGVTQGCFSAFQWSERAGARSGGGQLRVAVERWTLNDT